MEVIKELYRQYLLSSGVTTDSRCVKKGNIFFALKGGNFDGNAYAAAALENGAALAIIDNEEFNTVPGCLLVPDVLSCLQDLAAYHRKQLSIPVIGLTGTNGKTTTKELIYKVLSGKYDTHATAGNYNNHIGVPLTILGISEHTEIAVVEMGANHIGEIALLCEIASPGYGLITNIGKAHLEGFGGYQGVIKAKTEMFDYLRKVAGTAFVNHDDAFLMSLAGKLKKLTYGTDAGADLRGQVTSSIPFLEILWHTDDASLQIPSQLYGDYNFENIMAAICVGMSFGVDPKDIVSAISEYLPDNNRSQVIKSRSNVIYMDAYNANPSSMMAAIIHFEKQSGNKKVLILGDMFELGEESAQEHQKVLDNIRKKFQGVMLIGPAFSDICRDEEFYTFRDTDEAAEWLQKHPVEDASILVKGSRGITLEKLLDHL
ncbi:MAG: UDP-N-acetylmuramoyl-tripeptide--D-alanyl-D-alanine ligase [Bacteroidetes bacterium]|nr:UDP-N-acetylmuramoyl-tripeptide--D-alanyl-D-alanine ligase [Bacteroidota bacterium]